MFGGTESEIEGKNYILKNFKEFGLVNVKAIPTEYVGWKRVKASLEVIKPQNRSFNPWTLVYSPSSPPGGIESDLLSAGTGTAAAFTRVEDKAEGKIILVDSSTPVENGRVVHRRDKYGRAVSLGAKGFIYMNHLPGQLRRSGSLRTNAVAEIPGVAVSYEDGFYLQKLLDKGKVKMKLDVKTSSAPATAWQLMGEILGSKRRDEVIIVGAHYDSHDISPGAIDNKCSVADLLEVARALSKMNYKPDRTIRFMCFPIEEYAVTGSSLYTSQHRAELENVVLFAKLHHTGVAGTKLLDAQGYDDLLPYVDQLRTDLGLNHKPEFGIKHNSDAFSFVAVGVPTLEISGEKYPREYGLTEADTIDKIDPVDLKEGAVVTARTIIRLAVDKSKVLRHRSKKEILATMKKHRMEEVLRNTGQWQLFFGDRN